MPLEGDPARLGSALTLVHVFNDSAWASLMAVYDLPGWATVKPIEAAKRRLEQLCGQIANEFSLQTDVELLTGRASRLIGELAVARQARLVVVGEHGENGVKDIVLGGTALKVVETTRIPVLLVRRAEPGLYRSIVIATDFSVTAERAANLALDCFSAVRHALIHVWLVLSRPACAWEGRMKRTSNIIASANSPLPRRGWKHWQ